MKEFKITALTIVLTLLAIGISFAQVEKNKLILGLGYYNDNNLTQYLKANTKAKSQWKVYTGRGKSTGKFYISSESPEHLLGSAKTDPNGQMLH